jgi:hypothetical protein
MVFNASNGAAKLCRYFGPIRIDKAKYSLGAV